MEIVRTHGNTLCANYGQMPGRTDTRDNDIERNYGNETKHS